MATKVFVNYSGNALGAEQTKSIQKRIADALCICPEDIIVLGDVQSISVVEVPAEMTKAREKQDAELKAKEEKEAKELADHEAKIAKQAKEVKEKEAKEAAGPTEPHTLTTHTAHTMTTQPAIKGK